MYVMLLDATKAFDKVNYVKLFYQLIDRGLNPFIIRCLLYMYTHQCLNVSWNNSQSKYFPTTNGVKQGGVLSPILFSVYIDELLTRLKLSGYGCMVGHVYCGAFAYADDIVAPTTHALKAMCDIYVRTLLMSMIFSLTRQNVNLSNMANPMMYLFISMER